MTTAEIARITGFKKETVREWFKCINDGIIRNEIHLLMREPMKSGPGRVSTPEIKDEYIPHAIITNPRIKKLIFTVGKGIHLFHPYFIYMRKLEKRERLFRRLGKQMPS